MPCFCVPELQASSGSKLRRMQNVLRGLGLLPKLINLLGLPLVEGSREASRKQLFTSIYELLRLVCPCFSFFCQKNWLWN